MYKFIFYKEYIIYMTSIKELRSHRVFNISIFDVVMAWIGLYLIALYTLVQNPGITSTLCVFPLSIVAHAIFNIPTELNYKLGISEEPIR